MHNSRLLHVVLGLSLTTSSCWFKKSPRAFTPPPVQPRTAPPQDAPTLPDPPNIDVDPSTAVPPPISTSVPEAPEPPKPVRPRRGTPPPKVAPLPPQTPDPPAPPKLGQIFTPDQLREYNHLLDESLDRVRKALAVLAKKNLNAEQTEIAARVNTFQKQAEQVREQDLVTAVSLAKRADLLAQDLLDRLP
jgi:hypothetical protein